MTTTIPRGGSSVSSDMASERSSAAVSERYPGDSEPRTDYALLPRAPAGGEHPLARTAPPPAAPPGHPPAPGHGVPTRRVRGDVGQFAGRAARVRLRPPRRSRRTSSSISPAPRHASARLPSTPTPRGSALCPPPPPPPHHPVYPAPGAGAVGAASEAGAAAGAQRARGGAERGPLDQAATRTRRSRRRAAPRRHPRGRRRPASPPSHHPEQPPVRPARPPALRPDARRDGGRGAGVAEGAGARTAGWSFCGSERRARAGRRRSSRTGRASCAPRAPATATARASAPSCAAPPARARAWARGGRWAGRRGVGAARSWWRRCGRCGGRRRSTRGSAGGARRGAGSRGTLCRQRTARSRTSTSRRARTPRAAAVLALLRRHPFLRASPGHSKSFALSHRGHVEASREGLSEFQPLAHLGLRLDQASPAPPSRPPALPPSRPPAYCASRNTRTRSRSRGRSGSGALP